MKIAVVGTGYVGLVTGTCFAETGNDVICVDIDQAKIDKLTNGQITIYEPGLEKLFLRNLREERLSFTTSLEDGIRDALRFSLLQDQRHKSQHLLPATHLSYKMPGLPLYHLC